MFHYFSIQQNAYQLQKIQGCFEAQLPKFNQCCVTNAISIVYQKPDILCILKWLQSIWQSVQVTSATQYRCQQNTAKSQEKLQLKSVEKYN